MRIHMDDSRTLKILDPWTMMYVEYEQEFIEELHREIGPEHLNHPLIFLTVKSMPYRSMGNRSLLL